ncbi:MAG: XdhC family protein [Burkholderiaceae bacterium]
MDGAAANMALLDPGNAQMHAINAQVLERVAAWLGQGKAVALVTVVRNWGSAPRPLGSLFAATDAGEFIGSVSGGCVEDDLLRQFSAGFPQGIGVLRYGIEAEDMRRFGLPCGGTLELVVERVRDAGGIKAACDAIAAGRLMERRIDLNTGAVTLRAGSVDFPVRYEQNELVQLFGPRWRLLIVGAGMVSEFLARMAPALDFSVYVNDPREEQRRNWRTPGVQWLDGMPDDAVLAFRPDCRTVIVALSHDPKVDDMALMEALKTEAFYVGAIGSAASTRARRQRLLTLDLSPEQVDRLHAPVGLPIRSRAPAEIAVSILAELIACRNGQTRAVGSAACALQA